MERTEIIKAMECCYENTLSCIDCPYQDKDIKCSNLTINALSLIKELTEENERLKIDVEILKMPRATIFEIADAFERGRKKGKADTVRKMQAEIEARCIKGGIYPAFVKSTIAQIAEEMLNENHG